MMNIIIMISTLIIGVSCKSNPFWISVQLESIKWKDGCLTTALCAEPRLQIVEELLPLSERTSISWPISDASSKPDQPFVSYWPSGNIEDIVIYAEVVGVDGVYNFRRVCDKTPTVRVFKSSEVAVIQEFEDISENKTIQIKGKCFEATIVLSKHEERCPWCQDSKNILVSDEYQEIPVKASALASGITSLFALLSGHSTTDESMHIGILILASFALVISSAFAILLVIHIKSRRIRQLKKNNININVQPKLIPYQFQNQEARYDMPWDINTQKRSYFTSPPSSTSSSSSVKGYCTYRIPPPPSFAPPV